MLQDPKNFLVLRNEFSSLTGTGEGASILNEIKLPDLSKMVAQTVGGEIDLILNLRDLHSHFGLLAEN